MWLESEINPNENTFLGLLISIPGRVAQNLKHTTKGQFNSEISVIFGWHFGRTMTS